MADQPERPRTEPEIIPPGRQDAFQDGRRRPGWPPSGFQPGAFHGTQRVYVGRIGPLGFALLLLVLGLFGGVFLLALIGTALIWIPVVVAVVIIAAISRIWRQL